jgi:molybdate transport repressor ModE-like protein
VTLDLRRLRVLRAVAREGSFSAAARALDYTQPAVSHHVARLEAELGTSLLVRGGRGVRLTDAGRALVEHADAVLIRLASAEDEIAAIAGLRAGRVRLAAFPSASATLVPVAARALKDAHPEVTVSLIEAEPPEALALLRAGEVDVVVAFGYPESDVASGRDVQTAQLLDDPLALVLPAGRRTRRLTLADLADETWIAGCERCRAHLLHLAHGAGFEPRIAFATDDYVTVQALVAAGLGVALLPSLALAAARRADVLTLTLPAPAARQIAAVVPAAARQPPAVSAMLAALGDAAAGLRSKDARQVVPVRS